MKFTIKDMEKIINEQPSIELNESIHIHHCKSGHHNDRLYITRIEHGYLFYCHHCGMSGYYHKDISRRIKTKTNSRNKQTSARCNFSTPYDSEQRYIQFDARAKAWLFKYQISQRDIEQHSIEYSDKRQQLIFPFYDHGELIGYQARNFDPTWPKYVTIISPKYRHQCLVNNKKIGLHKLIHKDFTKVCIVEDVLSAIKVSKVSSSVAILGTHLSDEVLTKLLNYDKIYIWLDMDNPMVRSSARKIANRLSNLKPIHIITSDKDPKEYNERDIQARFI